VQGKAVVLWGLCPSQVTIDGGAELAALTIRDGASGTEVHALGLTGGYAGVVISGSEAVVLQHLWSHDSTEALGVEESLGATEVTVRDSLLESSTDLVAFDGGSRLTIERSLVRGLPPGATGPTPAGLQAAYDELRQTRPQVTVRQSVIEQVNDAGVWVDGGDVTVEASVIRDVLPIPSVPLAGHGVAVVEVPGQIGVATIQSSILERIPNGAIVGQTSTVLVHGTVIRDLGGPTPEDATAVFVTDGPLGRSALTLTESLSERTQGAGVTVYGSDAVIEGLAIRDVLPRVDLDYGLGLAIADDRTTLERSVAWVRGSSVERSRSLGLYIEGSEVTLVGVLVRDTLGRELDQQLGRGMQLQLDLHTPNPTAVSVDGSRVDNSLEAAICSASATVTITGTALSNTAPGLGNGTFGDGLVMMTAPQNPQSIGTLSVTDSLIADSQRAGLSFFGSQVTLTGARLECNTIHLDGEPQGEHPFELKNLGGNQCGCGQATEECKVLTTALAPPEPF
jgi:hypothetical protein